MGFYQFSQDEVAKITKILLEKESWILEQNLTWNEENDNSTTARYKSYNVLNFEGMEGLRFFLKDALDQFYKEAGWLQTEKRWVQCWANVQRKGQYLKMHTHKGCKLFGHITIACEGTRTTYYNEGYFELKNSPGLLTIVGREGVPHQTSVVQSEDKPRISIAFDLCESSHNHMGHMYAIDGE